MVQACWHGHGDVCQRCLHHAGAWHVERGGGRWQLQAPAMRAVRLLVCQPAAQAAGVGSGLLAITEPWTLVLH